MTGLPASAEAVRPRRASRYYVFRLRQDRHGGGPLIEVAAGPMTDLIMAWRAAGHYRRIYSSRGDPATFIAGDMDATMA